MDIIKDFLAKKPSSAKTKASVFFEENETLITKMLYESIPNINALELKKFWVNNMDRFHKEFVYDFNLVDWSRLARLVNNNLLCNQADGELDDLLSKRLKDRSKHADEIDNFFNSEKLDIPFNQDINNLRNMINNEKKMLTKTDIHNQDYLFYGILDFVSKVDERKTKFILKEDFLKWKTSLIKKATYSDEAPDTAYSFTKSILRASNVDEAKAKEKEAKKLLQKDDTEYRQKKKCLQLLKLQRKRYKEKLPDENEYSFVISYFSKVFTTVFDVKKNFWQYKWGEFKLAASKEEENLAKNDDQNRAQGSSIDCIISSKELGLDFVLLEVSGSMDKEDYVHFLKDRLKIAKNLKYIFKSILRQKLVVSDATDLKLYGIQVYRDVIYVYALLMPIMNMFCFVEILKFKIPTRSITYIKDVPRYIKCLFKTLSFASYGHRALKSYMTQHGEYESDQSCSDNDSCLSPPYISPQKVTNKRKEPNSSATVNKKQKL